MLVIANALIKSTSQEHGHINQLWLFKKKTNGWR